MKRIKIYGPPGTGKTTYALDLLCEHLVAQDRVLFISFTKAAKLEAESRLVRTFGSVPEHATVKTIHALCLKILNISADALFEKIPTTKKFYEHLDTVYRSNGRQRNRIADALSLHSYNRNTETLNIGEGVIFGGMNAHQDIIDQYEAWKMNQGFIDFTDLLHRVAKGEGEIPKYDTVIIDEAQDLTTLQWKVVDRLYANASTVYVVGDDDQAIYSFIGADVRSFLDWPCDAIRTLDYTYRLPKNILDYSMRLAIQIVGRQRKEVKAADRQGIIIDGISTLERLNYGARKTELYLTRNQYMQSRVEANLKRQGVPYKSRFSPFTSTAMHEGRLFRAIGYLHDWKVNGLDTKQWKRIRPVLKPSFVAYIEDTQEAALEDRPEGLPRLDSLFRPEDLSGAGWYEPFLDEMSAQSTSMFRTALALHTLDECRNPTLELSTIHGAKGQEADRVYVCSALTGKLHRGIEYKYDEHRLFYVAVTRTKDELILVNDFSAGKNQYHFPPTEA